MTDIERVDAYLEKAGAFYLTTVDGDKPKCRPVGFHMVEGDKLYFGIGTFDESVLNNDPKSLTFKLVRDTRFSPYKAHAEQEPCDLQLEFDLKNI